MQSMQTLKCSAVALKLSTTFTLCSATAGIARFWPPDALLYLRRLDFRSTARPADSQNSAWTRRRNLSSAVKSPAAPDGDTIRGREPWLQRETAGLKRGKCPSSRATILRITKQFATLLSWGHPTLSLRKRV